VKEYIKLSLLASENADVEKLVYGRSGILYYWIRLSHLDLGI